MTIEGFLYIIGAAAAFILGCIVYAIYLTWRYRNQLKGGNHDNWRR